MACLFLSPPCGAHPFSSFLASLPPVCCIPWCAEIHTACVSSRAGVPTPVLSSLLPLPSKLLHLSRQCPLRPPSLTPGFHTRGSPSSLSPGLPNISTKLAFPLCHCPCAAAMWLCLFLPFSLNAGTRAKCERAENIDMAFMCRALSV